MTKGSLKEFNEASKRQTINLIQDRATPHNNVLIEAFKANPEVKINLWYAEDQDKKIFADYPKLGNDLTNEHFTSNLYGSSLNWRFIWYCLTNSNERFVIVGWINANTRLLHLLFFILRRPFNHWTDAPEEPKKNIKLKKVLRFILYKLLNLSNSKVFVVGENSKRRFIDLGVSEKKLVNLPIFIRSESDLSLYKKNKNQIYNQYLVKNNQFVISAGSRLVFEKGYDLLIRAIEILPKECKENTKVIIVGSGEEEEELKQMIADLNLQETIHIDSWLPMEKFKTLIANSNLFVHPSRFDSFGGTALAMMLGVAVIGSSKAGAAEERIVQGVNGYLYEPENISDLSNLIYKVYKNPELLKELSLAAHKTALEWKPERGRDILINNAI